MTDGLKTALDRATNQHFLDFTDCLGGIQSLRANIDAIHDGMAAEQAVRILEVIETLFSCVITIVSDKTICLQQACWTDKLIGVPPE